MVLGQSGVGEKGVAVSELRVHHLRRLTADRASWCRAGEQTSKDDTEPYEEVAGSKI